MYGHGFGPGRAARRRRVAIAIALAPNIAPSATYTGTSAVAGVRSNTGSVDHQAFATVNNRGHAKVAVNYIDDNNVLWWAQSGNQAGEQQINIIRKRAGSPDTSYAGASNQLPRAAIAGDVIGLVARAAGVDIVFNGDVMFTVPAAYAYPDGRSTYAGILTYSADPFDNTGFITGGAGALNLAGVTVGPIANALSVTSTVANGLTKPTATIAYQTADAVTGPSGYEVQVEELNGTIISAYAAASIVSNSSPGNAVIRVSNVPSNQSKKYVNLRIREMSRPAVVAVKKTWLNTKPSVGNNIAPTLSYGARRFYANLVQGGEWARNVSPTVINNYGILDSEGRLTGLPDGTNGTVSGSMARRMGKPDAPCRVLITWDNGPTASQCSIIPVGGTVTVANVVVTGTRSIEADIGFSSWQASIGSDWAMIIDGSPGAFAAGTMTNFKAYPVGEDRNARIAASEIARSSRIKGPARFMDTSNTNNNYDKVYSWANRPTLNSIGGHPYGMCVEDIIAFCNATGRDAWITLPYRAPQGYVEGLAAALDAGLLPGLRIWFESGNEWWNTAFGLYHYANDYALSQGRITQAEHDNSGGAFGVLKEKKYISDTQMGWAETGVTSGRSIVRVQGVQQSGLFYEATTTNFDVVAIAPYFGNGNTSTWEADIDTVMDRQLAFRDTIRALGKDLVCYEGGIEPVATGQSTATVLAYLESSTFRTQFDRYLARWRDEFGNAFVHYYDVGADGSALGSWGALHFQGSTNSPRDAALVGLQAQIDAAA